MMKSLHRLAHGAAVCVAAIATTATLVSQQSSSAIEQISVRPDGFGANELSRDAAISADGRFVAFVSGATDLVAGSEGGLFVRDRQTQTTTAIPMSGAQFPGRPSMSGDGRFIVFAATEIGSERTQIYLHDRQTSRTRQISLDRQGNLSSTTPVISANGRFVAYLSQVADKDFPYGVVDVAVVDINTGGSQFANISTNGELVSALFDPDYGVSLSADGQVVAFTFGPALVTGQPGGQIYVRDLALGTTEVASLSASGEAGGGIFGPALSADGRFVAFQSPRALVPDDANGMPDIFVRDRQLGLTERVSVDDAGQEAPQGANLADSPSISGDGRFVAFVSISPLTPGDTNNTYDVLVRDRLTSRTTLVSGTENGVGDNLSFGPALSRDGRSIAFSSEATNLSPASTSPAALMDVFARPWVVAPALRIETPNTRSDWGIGTTQRLAWFYDGAATDFDIEVSRDNEATWEFIARVPNKAGTSQSFYWRVEGPPTNTARFRVTAVGEEDAADVNDIDVRIAAPFITVLRPTSDQVLHAGALALVFFMHNLGARTPIALEVSVNGGDWMPIASDPRTLGSTTSSFRWAVPSGMAGQVRIRVRGLDGSGAVGVSSIVPVGADSASYSIVDLGTLGGRSSRAYGLNDLRDVVGTSTLANDYYHAFLWRSGTMIDLGVLPDTFSSEAFDVNNHGVVVGVTDGVPFVWQDGVMAPLPLLSGDSQGIAWAINDEGVIVGNSGNRAVQWRDRRVEALDDGGGGESGARGINERGEIVGYVSGPRSRPTLWIDGVLHFLSMTPTGCGIPSCAFTAGYASGINESGMVSGIAGAANWGRAVVWSEGRVSVLHKLPDTGNTEVYLGGINNAGAVAGSSTIGPPESSATVATAWSADGEPAELPPLPGAHRYSFGAGINQAGHIAGISTTAAGYPRAVLWIPRSGAGRE